ncbi:hypothetical protein [Jutongia sp.]
MVSVPAAFAEIFVSASFTPSVSAITFALSRISAAISASLRFLISSVVSVTFLAPIVVVLPRESV